MRKLFERTVSTAVTMDLVDLAVQAAVGGTKVASNAPVNMSYDAASQSGLLERQGRIDAAQAGDAI